LASSSKRIIQIAMLLAERKMTFSFCLNEPAMLQESMVGVSFQAIALGPDSALFREDWKLMMAACDRLESQGVLGSCEFRELLENLASRGANKPRASPISRLEECERPDSKVKIHFQDMDYPPDRRADLCSTQASTQNGDDSLRSVPNNTHLVSCSERMLSPEGFGAENMSGCSTALNLDCMTFSVSPIGLNHAGISDGSKSTDWDTPLSALADTRDIHDSVRSSSRCQPPSIGGFSSLASSSPNRLNSVDGIDMATTIETYATQSCSATGPWSSDSDFTFNAPYYLRQRGVDVVLKDSNDTRIGSGANAAIPSERLDDEFVCMAAAQTPISPPGTFGDVDLFGVDLGLVI
jgi:hypothetical protein